MEDDYIDDEYLDDAFDDVYSNPKEKKALPVVAAQAQSAEVTTMPQKRSDEEGGDDDELDFGLEIDEVLDEPLVE